MTWWVVFQLVHVWHLGIFVRVSGLSQATIYLVSSGLYMCNAIDPSICHRKLMQSANGRITFAMWVALFCIWLHIVLWISSNSNGSGRLFSRLRPKQNGRRFTDDTFKRIFLTENVRISIKVSLKFVPNGPINNNPTLVQIMAWRRSGDKPLSEPMMVRLPTHICVTRPQWVNTFRMTHCLIIEVF